MKTDIIKVDSEGLGLERALDATENFARQMRFDRKNTMRLRLLSEETLGMVRAIVGVFEADFWIESTDEGGARIHLLAQTFMNYDKKQEMISVATNRTNAATVGIMGKIQDLFENGLYHFEDFFTLSDADGNKRSTFGFVGENDLSAMQSYGYWWSLEQYREDVANNCNDDEDVSEARDELEKSIVANIADDVRVHISGDKVEMIIEKLPTTAGK